MEGNDSPPTYEESNLQYKNASSNINNGSFILTRGPDAICFGQCFFIVDFIPWNESNLYEDMGYLLLRTNNWLRVNPSYDIAKCEMIPRMINSKRTLEVSNCYIFNMSYGRRYFVNQLRLHIRINKEKVEPDHICLRTIIPELIHGVSRCSENMTLLMRLLKAKTGLPRFEGMNDTFAKLNNYIEDCSITGTIINISTFYLNIVPYLINPNTELQDNVCFYEDSNQGKCHLKSLRVFYKPGSKICGNIEFKSFTADSKCIETLDDLVNSSLYWIINEKNHNLISLETFQEYSVKEEFELNPTKNSQDSTFCYFAKCSTLTRTEVVNLYYFSTIEHPEKCLQTIGKGTDIIWITPRRNIRKIYETYDSLMEYLGFIVANYGEHILDVETVLVPNPLSWSAIRYQTLKRYYNENVTNYHIYTFRLIVNAGSIILPLKGAPPPYASPTKYSATCTVF